MIILKLHIMIRITKDTIIGLTKKVACNRILEFCNTI